jgi:hypothetical protein
VALLTVGGAAPAADVPNTAPVATTGRASPGAVAPKTPGPAALGAALGAAAADGGDDAGEAVPEAPKRDGGAFQGRARARPGQVLRLVDDSDDSSDDEGDKGLLGFTPQAKVTYVSGVSGPAARVEWLPPRRARFTTWRKLTTGGAAASGALRSAAEEAAEGAAPPARGDMGSGGEVDFLAAYGELVSKQGKLDASPLAGAPPSPVSAGEAAVVDAPATPPAGAAPTAADSARAWREFEEERGIGHL